MQPNLTKRDEFDDNDITATAHAEFGLFDTFRGTKGANAGTKLFWTAYVSTGFEEKPLEDLDPNTENDGVGLGMTYNDQVAVIYLEIIRDSAASAPVVGGEQEARRRVTVHELGHFFDVADVEDEHRNDVPNVMSAQGDHNLFLIEDDKFFFHPLDVAKIRRTLKSPGT